MPCGGVVRVEMHLSRQSVTCLILINTCARSEDNTKKNNWAETTLSHLAGVTKLHGASVPVKRTSKEQLSSRIMPGLDKRVVAPQLKGNALCNWIHKHVFRRSAKSREPAMPKVLLMRGEYLF